MINNKQDLTEIFKDLKILFHQLKLNLDFVKNSEKNIKESKYFQNDYNRGINYEQEIIKDIEEIIKNINYYFEDNNIDEYLELKIHKYTDKEIKESLEIIENFI